MPNRFAVLRVDTPDARADVVAPLVAVSTLAAAGLGLEGLGAVKAFYASPFILLTAAMSIRRGVRAGILTGMLVLAVWNIVFVAPRWQITVPTPEQMVAYLSMLAAGLVGLIPRSPARTTGPPTEPPARLFPFQSSRLNGAGDGDRHALWWDVEATGDWVMDCEIGAEYGRIFLAEPQHQAVRPMLGWVVRGMIQRGRWTGIECGFINVVAAKALQEPAPQDIMRALGPSRIARQDDTDDRYPQ